MTTWISDFVLFTRVFLRIMWRVRSIIVFMSLWLVIGSVVIMAFEDISFGTALYFSFITGLTIGYGDVVMKTPAGQVLSVLIGLTGIIFTGVIVAVAVETVREVLHNSRQAQ